MLTVTLTNTNIWVMSAFMCTPAGQSIDVAMYHFYWFHSVFRLWLPGHSSFPSPSDIQFKVIPHLHTWMHNRGWSPIAHITSRADYIIRKGGRGGSCSLYSNVIHKPQQVYFCFRNVKPACAPTALILMLMGDDVAIADSIN